MYLQLDTPYKPPLYVCIALSGECSQLARQKDGTRLRSAGAWV